MITTVVEKFETGLTNNDPSLTRRMLTVQPARSPETTGLFRNT